MAGRRLIAIAGTTAAALLFAAPMAGAAPKNGLQFSVTCPGLDTFDVVTPPGNGTFTPAFGPNGVAISYRLTGTVTVNGEVVDEFDDVKPAPVPANALTCTFTTTFEDPGGNEVMIAGTAVVVQRP
jgi:hypothetical protein